MIAYDAFSSGIVNGTSLTFAHTCTGADRILFVGVNVVSTLDRVSGVTYGGVAMTKIDGLALGGAGNGFLSLYYLIAPATDANNVVISLTGTYDIHGTSTSYTGALQSGVPDASNTGSTDTATSLAVSVTTVLDNCWVVAVENNTVGTATSLTGGSIRGNGYFNSQGDSNGVVTPAGAKSMTWNFAAAKACAIHASFAPVVATTSSGFFAFM